MDPDRRVQEAISLVFRKFAELGSVRQVHLWLRHEAMELSAQVHEPSQRLIVWKSMRHLAPFLWLDVRCFS